ncbi:MAG: XdhC family protein [bacterium]
MDVWRELADLEKQGIQAALVTVIGTKGSVPREVGAKMIVQQDGTISGTVGGSAVEALVIKDALEAISQGKARTVEYSLDDAEKASTGMICGGRMEFFIEPLRRVPRLYIFGGGHIALPLARIAAELGYLYSIFDDRPEFASEARFPTAALRRVGSYDEMTAELELIPPAYIIVITRCHETDLAVMRGVLDMEYEYLGLICSRKKKVEMFKLLEAEGFSRDRLDCVHAPIGLDIGSKTPAEIAVSIMAEIIKEFQQNRI